MTIGIRTWRSRLKNLEQKNGAGNSTKFYLGLSEDHLDALCNLTEAQLEEGEIFSEDVAISFLTDCLDGDARTARYLWATQESLPPDPTFQRMSDDELTEYILRTRDECHQLEVELETRQ